jgi:hypothetical protein
MMRSSLLTVAVMSVRAVAVLLVTVILLGCAGGAERCEICRRDIHPRVRAMVGLADCGQVLACCPRCALHYQAESGKAIREIRVTDYAGGGLLPFAEAFLVEGSDETPCLHHPPVTDPAQAPMQVCYDRCMPSLIAFRTAAAAHAFADEHGGTPYPPGRFPGLPGSAAR